MRILRDRLRVFGERTKRRGCVRIRLNLDLIGRATRTLFVGLGLVWGLAACAGSDGPNVFPDLTFANLQQIDLGARALTFVPGTVSSRQPPNIEHLSPVSFAEALAGWSAARFAVNGVGDTEIQVRLLEGSIIERKLDVDGGIRGALKVEQAAEYEARVKAEMIAIASDGTIRAQTEAEVWQTRTVPEDVSARDKQMVLFEMVEATVSALDQKLVPEFRRYFSTFVL